MPDADQWVRLGGMPHRTEGLTAAEVSQRRAEGRTNDATTGTGRSVVDILRANVATRFNAILGVLCVIVLTTGHWLDAMFGVVIVINSVVGIVQELRAKATLDRLSIVGQAGVRVRRDGTMVELVPTELVVDDVIEVGAGDQLVVDGSVLAAQRLEVDESLLTGESDPVAKQLGDGVRSGSFVAAGSGIYRATGVGAGAYAARVTTDAGTFTLVDSQLRNGINRILTYITYLVIPIGALTIYNQLHRGGPPGEALRGMVAALVPMVPEGLVLMTSIAFAVGVIRLAARNCLVNELPALEGLARVDVVCTDKTGTLTENAMRVGGIHRFGSIGDDADRALAALAAADPRPNASMAAIAQAFPDDPGWKVRVVEPFSSARKWSGVGFAETGDWILGAPDVLLAPDAPERLEAERVSAQGLRVLLLARVDRVDAPAGPGRVIPAALVILEQRVRPDAKNALEYFARQHVDVKVVSGDNAASVAAVARSVGLPDSGGAVDARALPSDDGAFIEAVNRNTVFGRVSPEQKRTMVGALHTRGHAVAMTGDGVNDVLALKDADIGVAMGTGSPAARAVAQIVLLDNCFATLPAVVGEGRRVIGNIERVATLFLTKTTYSVWLAFLVGVPGLLGFTALPYPFLPRHVTIVGWFTIGLPAFVLSLAPNNDRARPGFVPRVLRFAVPAGTVVGIGCFVSYVLARHGHDAADARTREQISTTALLTLIALALWVLATVMRPMSVWKLGLFALMVAASALMFTIPALRRIFELDPGNTGTITTALVCAAGGIVALELVRRLSASS